MELVCGMGVNKKRENSSTRERRLKRDFQRLLIKELEEGREYERMGGKEGERMETKREL